MKLKIVPYTQFSKSARSIRAVLPASKIVKAGSATYRPRGTHILLNWGNPRHFSFNALRCADVINWPENVAVASNKLLAFYRFKEYNVSIPEFTESEEEAESWCKEGETVGFARKLLCSSEGKGIIPFSNEVPLAPLYVKYKKKKKEFRIHVFNGKIIDAQEKRRRQGVEVNTQIRNFNNGWVFCHEQVFPPDDALSNAVLAVKCLGLTFGAVDVIWNGRENKSYVLEVNSAPGIEGTTLQKYIAAIQEYINENR